MEIVRLIAVLIPIVDAIITMIEDAASGVEGAVKKERAIEFLSYIWDFLANDPSVDIKEIKGLSFDAVKPIVSFLIDLGVRFKNLFGIFSH